MSGTRGLTVVELTIVVALALLIAAISVPSVRQNLQKKRAARCALQLEALRVASRNFAAETGAPPRTPAELVPAYLPALPVCPSGGAYALGDGADAPPTCSIPGHHF
jgi:Tfp pilus assembly protein PilE